MFKLFHGKTITLGFALFSMFFGAGNVVFPLVVGKETGSYIYYAILGLFLTAVILPFVGLYAAMIMDGCHKKFFSPLGKIGGLVVAAAILGLLGPFGVIPRCVALSQATFNMYFPYASAWMFDLISCVLILAFTLRKNKIVSLLGNIMTPALIAVLGAIIVFGIYSAPNVAPLSTMTVEQAVTYGALEGYQTMDLLAALFFASFITVWLRENIPANATREEKLRWRGYAVNAIIIAAVLIAAVYVGFGILAARLGYVLDGVPQAQLLGTIAGEVLGINAGLIVCLAVCLACLTTAISLAGVFAQFVSKDITGGRLSYSTSLIITVAITFCFSLLDFNGIVGFLGPILSVFYPVLILLTGYNILRHRKSEITVAST